MDMQTLVTAAQIERGLNFYGCSFHPDEERGSAIRFVKSFEDFEPGDLLLCEDDGHYYIMRVSQVRDDLNLDVAARCNIWATCAVTEKEQEFKDLREQERNASRRLARSIAIREASQAMEQIGMNADQLFLGKDKG